MNAQKSMYESTLSNLANSHHVQTSAAVMGTEIDDKLAVAQTLTNEFGNQLLGASSITGLAKISKFAKLSRIEKAKAVARAVLGKDPETTDISEASRQAQEEARARLPASPFESAPRPTVDSQEGVRDAEQQRDPDFRNDEFETYDRDPEGTDSNFYAQMGGRAQPTPEDGELDDEYHDASEVPEAGEEGADIASSVAKGVTEAGDVEKTLTAATEASAATDEDPLGLVVTAGLGIATLIGGMFIHPSKPKVIQQAAVVLPNNYSVQAGLS